MLANVDRPAILDCYGCRAFLRPNDLIARPQLAVALQLRGRAIERPRPSCGPHARRGARKFQGGECAAGLWLRFVLLVTEFPSGPSWLTESSAKAELEPLAIGCAAAEGACRRQTGASAGSANTHRPFNIGEPMLTGTIVGNGIPRLEDRMCREGRPIPAKTC